MIIAVECYADEKFVRALVPVSFDKIRHLFGKGKIVNYLRKSSTIYGTGLVDEDPGSTQPMDFIANYAGGESLGTVSLYRHISKNGCSIIMLRPRLEEWLIARAGAAGITLAEYNLPVDACTLHKYPHYEKSEGFNAFLEKLIGSGDEEVTKVQEWVALKVICIEFITVFAEQARVRTDMIK